MFHFHAVVEALPVIAIYTAIIVALIKVNEWHYGRRMEMTPEERKREDEEMRDHGDW